jgi:hypothetical protein
MAVPLVTPWIEERRELPGLFVPARDIATFERIAVKATESKICRRCSAPVLDGDNMIDFERKATMILVHLAIFATASRTFPYQLRQGFVHGHQTS